jgi:(2R)-3-sulfolactate dehydrogenase (NADP+)
MSTQTLGVEEIVRLAEAALVAHGATALQARPLAEAIAAAERDGLRSHGLMYLPIYCEHLQCGKVVGTAEPVLTRPAPGTVLVDAQSGFAHPAIHLGFPAMFEAARANGIACLAVKNSYNAGVLGQHTEAMARAGFAALGFTNAPASIAPWGAKKPVLGTNPWSLAVPGTDGEALFVIDQSASVVAKSEVMKRAKSGDALPEGWALDPDGKPTTDAALGLKGSMMPAGGYKGFGTALLVEVFAACLAGAMPGIAASPFSGPVGGPPRTGQFFIAIRPEVTSGGDFADRMRMVVAAIAAETDGRLQNSRRVAARRASDAEGIRLEASTVEMLMRLSGGPAR